MPQHHQQTHSQRGNGVFQRGEHGVIDDMPGRADREQLAQAGIEDDVRAYARIGAAEHRGIGRVRVDQRLAGLGAAVRMHRLALREPAVARQQATPDAACGALHFVLVHEQLVVCGCIVHGIVC